MKKLVARFISLALAAALLLCACGPAASGGQPTPGEEGLDPANPITLTLWHYYVGENQQALESAVSAFNQTIGIEKGVIVDAVAKGSIAELEEAVTASAMGIINAEPMPDLFSSYPDKAMEIDALDMVCDLGAYFTQEEKDLYVQGFLADGIFEGDRFLLVPIVKSTELLYLNDTGWQAFAAAGGYEEGNLATWEGLYEAARAYYQWTDAETPDTAWNGRGLMGFDSVANYVIIGCKQLGVDVIDAAGRQAVLDETALRRLFEVYYQGIALGYFDAVGKFRSDDIKSGDLIAYVGSSSSAAYFPTWIEQDSAQADIAFQALGYPVFQGGEAYAIQQGAGMCVANTGPARQAGAAIFLKWFTAVAQNIGFAMTTGYLPVQTAAYEDAAFTQALTALREGDASQNNVAAVYEIALHQITEAGTYAAKPFDGSYSVRSILQSTLIDSALAGREAAAPVKQSGAAEDELLQALDVDTAFAAWIAEVKARLDDAGIAYK